MTTPAARRPRADALRNREKVLAAAAEVFAEQGTDAALEEVARRAGVGIGTLYRHFPTRAALVEHVYRDGVARLAAQARELLDTRPIEDAVNEWVLAFADYAGRKRDTAAALRAALGDDSALVFSESRVVLTDAANLIFDRAREAGVIRGDVDPWDALRTVSGVCMAGNDARDPEASRRMLRIVLDGLRFGAGSTSR
jgi:AcrR family transcriptional regulator